MLLLLLFVLASSCALGMDTTSHNLQIQDASESNGLYAFDEDTDNENTPLLDNNWTSAKSLDPVLALIEKLKKTPTTKFYTLETEIPLLIMQRALSLFLEEVNVNEKIAAHKNTSSGNCFKNQQYHRCDCTSPNHQLKFSDQNITYFVNEGTVTVIGQKKTLFRAELFPFDVKSDVTSKNEIYVIQKDTTGSSIFVGPHIATLENSLTKDENVSITIANDADSEKIIGVVIEGYNYKDELASREKLTGKTTYTRPKSVFHYVATPKKATQILLDEVGDAIQIINREALSENNFQAPEILENQIKSYAKVQQLIAKRSKKQKNCSMQ